MFTQAKNYPGTRRFLKEIGISRSFIIITIAGYIIGFALRGLGITLIIPFAKGLIEKDYAFIFSNPIAEFITRFVPWLPGLSNGQMFALFSFSIVFLTLVSMGVNYFISMYIWRQREEYSLRASMLILQKYLSPDTNFFVDYKSSELRSRLESITGQTNGYINSSQNMYQAFFEVTTAIIVLVAISPQKSLIAIMFFVLYVAVFHFVQHKIKDAIVRSNKSNVQYGSLIQDLLGRQNLIHIFNKQKDEYNQFAQTYRSLVDQKKDIERIHRLIGPFSTLFQIVAILVMALLLGNILLFGTTMSVPAAVVFIVLFDRGMNKTKQASVIYINKKGTWETLVDLVEDIMNKEPGVVSGDVSFTHLSREIRISNLSFSFDNKKIFEDFSACIPAHVMTVIAGPNGSGKSTLLSLILRLRNCPPRTIFIDDVDIHEYDILSLRSRIAYVAQDITLFSDSLRNNIMYGAESVNDEDIMHAMERVGLKSMVESLPEGLDTNIGDGGVKFSGGQRQRMVIARALLRTPEIIIFDEATKSVDAETEKIIMKILSDDFKHTTRIVVTHNPEHIAQADHVITLK